MMNLVTDPMNNKILLLFLFWIFLCPSFFTSCTGLTIYEHGNKLFEDKMGPKSGYNTALRPLTNLSKAIEVDISFSAVAIVGVDAITQKFVVNGFLGLMWRDELLAWNSSEYGNIEMIHPFPKQIWRPRVVLVNTLEDRDLFADDYCPVILSNSGHVSWYPGSLFQTSCKLNMYKYPFDTHTCYIDLFSMGLNGDEITFKPLTDQIDTHYYVESGEWKIENSSIQAGAVVNSLAHIKIGIELRRLPGYFIVNIVAPIVLMSFLNILVFVIPVDSGEKISYGITVLLALTVFMSIVSGQLPRSSDTLPLVTIYLLVLTVISVLTVIATILIVYCHHREENEVKQQKTRSGFKAMINKVKVMNRAAANFNDVRPARNHTSPSDLLDRINARSPQTDPEVKEEGNGRVYVNRWRQIGKHLDRIFFVIFMVIWISVTIGFLVEIAR